VQLSLVDSLRCPAHSQESTLVLSVAKWAGPRVAEGELGCPICHARYPIHEGGIDFTAGTVVRRSAITGQQDPMRLVAQLNLMEPGGMVLLAGSYGMIHEAIATVVEVMCLIEGGPPTLSPLAVNLDLNERVPLADRTLRGAAVDATGSRLLPDLVRCVKPGGRIVAPRDAALPAGVALMARDEREWVAEVDAGETIQLRRSGRPVSL
jgi:hypothetical protein